MGPQLQRFSTDVSRSLNRTRFTLATKQLARSASERACYWTGNDTTNLLASVRELNEVVTKTPRDELQTLMPTVFSPLSKAINHEEVEVRRRNKSKDPVELLSACRIKLSARSSFHSCKKGLSVLFSL